MEKHCASIHPVLKPIVVLALILFIPAVLSGCAREGIPVSSVSQLHEPGRKIGVSAGAPEEILVRHDFPDAEIVINSDLIATYTEVATGKIDACIHSRSEMEAAIRNGITGVRLLDEVYCENTVAVGLSRKSSVPALKKKINAFLQELKENGTLDEMYNRWVVEGDETMPDIPEPEKPEGVLHVATTGNIVPYSYYEGNKLSGYDIELAKRFAAWLNMRLLFSVYDFSGIFQAVQMGDVDCAMANLYRTEEHEEAIDFSDPIFMVEVTTMVRDVETSSASGGSFWNFIVSSFKKTFILESRWKLLAQGAWTTFIITVLAILAGTLLGFGVYLLCRRGGAAADAITRLCVRLVNGIPAVVFLMILYYVILGNVQISRTVVSVAGFAIIFGAGVYSILKTGIATVDGGQAEAAYALGYSQRRTFFRIILPQAMPFILPAYTEQVTSLVKATAVVGYIAVQDLTKMGDIIRGRTYEAFFPLFTVAVIYFALAALLTFAVRRIGRLLDTRAQKESVLLKGVKLHD